MPDGRLQCLGVERGRRRRAGRTVTAQRGGNQRVELLDALAVLGRDQADRNADLRSKLLAVDADTHRGRLVGHVEHEYHGKARPRDLGKQPDLALDLRSIEHDERKIDDVLRKKGRGDGLVARMGAQIVDPRQVHEVHHLSAEQDLRTQQIDRDAGPVSDSRVRAGQAVEEGRLARIGHSDERDTLHRQGGAGFRSARAGPGSGRLPRRAASGR